ncbi:hypothetical protein PSM7751_04269 [Pseudooceanicola marinus]|uniref:Uncharacterized protein n=1 Tax=Pseudooceanicola marinus TaxID=396013 RepID=A0A1X7AC08_9RHOB|nr:hypothetical protein PSM7751_04269 [Pseudooceanicola marinus]
MGAQELCHFARPGLVRFREGRGLPGGLHMGHPVLHGDCVAGRIGAGAIPGAVVLGKEGGDGRLMAAAGRDGGQRVPCAVACVGAHARPAVLLGDECGAGGVLGAARHHGPEGAPEIQRAGRLAGPLAVAGLDQRRQQDGVLVLRAGADRVQGPRGVAGVPALLGIGQHGGDDRVLDAAPGDSAQGIGQRVLPAPAAVAMGDAGKTRREQAKRRRAARALHPAVGRDGRGRGAQVSPRGAGVEAGEAGGQQGTVTAAGQHRRVRCAKRAIPPVRPLEGQEAGRHGGLLTPARGGDGADRLLCRLHPPAVGEVDQEGCLGLQHVARDAAGDAREGVVGQGADGTQAEARADLLGAVEDRGAGDGPVDALRGRAPGLQRARDHAGIVRRPVGRFGPDNGLAVKADDDEEPLADRGRAVVAGPQLARLHLAAQLADGLAPPLERLAPPLRAGHRPARGLDHRAPGLPLLDILHDDHVHLAAALLDALDPAGDDPGQIADVAGHGRAALGLGEVAAIGAEPHQADMAAGEMVEGIDAIDVLAQVQGLGVVGRMQGQGGRVVVDGDVGAAAQGHIDPGRGATAAGEAVDDQRRAEGRPAGVTGQFKVEKMRSVHQEASGVQTRAW